MNLKIHLQIFAVIVILSHQTHADCTSGNENVADIESSPIPDNPSGLYIDIDNPVPCTGQLTVWYFCYYEPFNTKTTMYSLQLTVWRFDLQTNTYSKQGEEDVSIRVRRRRDDFKCDDVSLKRNKYIDIQRGDYLGVVLGDPTLPLSGVFSGSRVFHASATDLTDEVTGMLREIGGSGLHLSADIIGDEQQFQTTAASPVATTVMTQQPETTVMTQQPETTVMTQQPETTTTVMTTVVTTTRSTNIQSDSDLESNPTDFFSTVSSQNSQNTTRTTPDVNAGEFVSRNDALGVSIGVIVGISIAVLAVLVCVGLLLLGVAVCARRRGYINKEVNTHKEATKHTSKEKFDKYDNTIPLQSASAGCYELPVNPNAANKESNSRSNTRRKHTLNLGRVNGENWFNDSFEGSECECNTRYTSRAKIIENPDQEDYVSIDGGNADEHVYECDGNDSDLEENAYECDGNDSDLEENAYECDQENVYECVDDIFSPEAVTSNITHQNDIYEEV